MMLMGGELAFDLHRAHFHHISQDGTALAYISYIRSEESNELGNSVTVKAFNFNKAQQLSTNGMQQVQYQSLKNLILQ